VRRSMTRRITRLNVREMVQKRIEQLQKGYNSFIGWRNILGDFDAQNICSSSRDPFNIQTMKCKYLVD
jgi:hypothetical protein